MSAAEVAALVVAVSVAMATVGLLVALGALLRTLADARRAMHDIHAQAVPLLGDLRVAVRQANDELDHRRRILTAADSITTTVDSASRLAHQALANPVVKGAALATGVVRGVRRLRERP